MSLLLKSVPAHLHIVDRRAVQLRARLSLGSLDKGVAMELSNKSARQMFYDFKERPTRARFGFGAKPALINIDLQKAYTAVGQFATAYETDPKQLAYINELAELARARGLPVVWTHVAYLESGEDCGVWGTRSNTADSLQNIKLGSARAEFDDRLAIDRGRDIIINKRMASAFHETNLASLLTFHRCDTLIVTGGSTSGCVRATVVDSLSHSYRTIVPEECVADKHESPHFANLYDMAVKYADVLPVADVIEHLRALKA
jgi:nicotinamidase-related amidase